MSLGLNWEKAWLRLRLLAREGSGPGFRKPLSWPWQVGLGVAAVVTFVIVYSLLSWYRQSEKDTVYTLTAKSLTFLRGREVPPLVVASLRPLVGKSFATEQEYLKGLTSGPPPSLNERDIDNFRGALLAAAEKDDSGYKITAKSLLTLASPRMPAELVDKLTPLVGKTLRTEPGYLAGLQAVLPSDDLERYRAKLLEAAEKEKVWLPTWQQLAERKNIDDKLLPNWSQLWFEGVLQNLTPVSVPVSGGGREDRLKAADAVLRAHFGEEEDVRVKAQVARLKALAVRPIPSEVLQAEADRRWLLPNLPLEDRKWKEEDDLEKAQTALTEEERKQAEEGLRQADEYYKKVEDTYKKGDEVKFTYQLLLWEDVRATSWRLLVGMAITMFVSIALGLAMGCYSVVEAYLYPPLAVLAKIPGTAMLSLFLVVSALSEFRFGLYMILFGMIPTVTQTIYGYVKDVPEELIFKARTLGASQMECIWSVIFRQILPKVIETLRLAIGPALIFLYAAELTFGDEGLGCRLRLALHKGLVETPTVYFYLVVIAVFGFAIDGSLRWLQRKLFSWYYSE